MGLTLQKVLVRTLNKLEDSSFQRFIKKLSVWEVREEYRNIPKAELTGKDPEHVAGLIYSYYRYAYGAEVTLSLLEDIGEKKVREELQQDLSEVDVSGHGLGTAMFTEKVNFIENHKSDLFSWISDVDSVLLHLREQSLLTEEQYNDVMKKRRSGEKMKALCDIISHWEDTGKYTAYTLLRKYYEAIINDLEAEDRIRRYISKGSSDRAHFVDKYRTHLINNIKKIKPVLSYLQSHHLLTEDTYQRLQEMTRPEDQMTCLCDILVHQPDTVKDQFYISLWRYNYTVINNLEKSQKLAKLPQGQGSISRWPSWSIQENRITGPFTSHREWRHSRSTQYGPSAGSPTITSYVGGLFMGRHKEYLIERIQNVDPVINHLYYKSMLTRDDCEYVMEKKEPKDRMSRLCDIISDRDADVKEQVNRILYMHNPPTTDIPEFKLKKHAYKLNKETSQETAELQTSREKMAEDHISYAFFEKPKMLTVHQKLSISGKRMGLTLQKVLMRALKKLEDSSFQRFKEKLSVWEVRKEYRNIPKDKLSEKDPEYVTGLINKYYRYAYGAEVTLDILQDIGEKKVREELQCDLKEVDISGRGLGTTMFTDRVNFVEGNQSTLIRRITDVDPVLRDLRVQDLLTEEQYNDLMKKRGSEETMEALCDIISHWKDTGKYTSYKVLKKHEEELIKDLEAEEWMRRYPQSYIWGRDHFVNRHKYHIIHDIREVNPVLDDLQSNNLLTRSQYENLQAIPRAKEKMTHLWNIFRHQPDAVKDQFYISLWRYNYTVINDLEKPAKEPESAKPFLVSEPQEKEARPQKENPKLPMFSIWPRLTLQEVLVKTLKKLEESSFRRFIKNLSVWEARKEHENINELTGKDQEHVAALIDRYYRYAYGAEVTLGLLEDIGEKKVREELQQDLRGVDISGHGLGTTMFTDRVNFVDNHQSDLIIRITSVDPVLRDPVLQGLLANKQFIDVRKKRRSGEKMKALCDIISHWEDTEKYTAYTLLRKYNRKIIKDLEAKAWMRTNVQSQVRGGDHFVDRHREHLINHVKNVNKIIEDLRVIHLLGKKNYKLLNAMTRPEEQMRRLLDIVCPQSDTVKDQFYISLWRYNYTVINNLEKSDKEPISTKYFPAYMPQETSQKTAELQTSREKMAINDISCKLCGEQASDLADLVHPIAIGSVYRLALNSPGLYRCQKTGIKFLVKGPVTIEYKLDSWSDHLKHIPDNPYEVLGPLFNIQTRGEPDAISAVYLPHYLCLKGFSEDPALIKCAHFQDGNLTLESPAQIEPYYITLQNPTFSCLGPLLSLRKKKIPIHGSVFIYFRILCKGDPHEEYKIHLYVLPYSTNAEETLDKENKKFGYHRIKKHEHTTDTVYTKLKYLITGHPGISTHPKTLRFDSEPYQFTEVQLKEKDVNIYLSVLEEKTKGNVWDTQLTQGDLRDIEQFLSPLTIHEHRAMFAGACLDHFVDRHREALIQRTSHISPVLDCLLGQRLLTQEQYDTLRSMRPHQEAMRQLYKYGEIWGHIDKEKLYQALKTYNEPLIRDLEHQDTVQL